ncbi:MAG: hypothetical protein Q8N09_00400 [Thermodesulfovibrionia bacterium]|nr:hypothetical protein [Thermodesulfovibrionia bacterium]
MITFLSLFIPRATALAKNHRGLFPVGLIFWLWAFIQASIVEKIRRKSENQKKSVSGLDLILIFLLLTYVCIMSRPDTFTHDTFTHFDGETILPHPSIFSA